MYKIVIPSLLFLLLSTVVLADDSQELSDLLKNYNTVTGNFVQTLVDAKGEMIQDSSGVFTVKKPGYFRWDTQSPFPQLLVSDLQTIWLYDPDLEQVTIQPYQNNVDQTPALLLSGDVKKITEHYTVSKANDDSKTFVLKPLAAESTFTELRMKFADSLLSSMILSDSLLQTTTFNFSQLQLNQSVPDSDFQFTPPEGVDVLIDE